MRKPWFWKARKKWFVNTDDGRIDLGETEEDAYEEWERLKSLARQEKEYGPSFLGLSRSYAKYAKRQILNGEIKQKTYDDYRWYIKRFAQLHADKPAVQISPAMLTDWIDANPTWGPSHQRNAIGAISRVLNWGASEKRISENPIANMPRPSQTRREALVSEDDHKAMILHAGAQKSSARVDRQIRVALIAVRHCGGRPQDVANATVENVEITDKSGSWTLLHHKRQRHTGRPRIVYLSPCLRTITMMLIAGRTDGPLFRGRRGALTTNAITCRIKRLKKQLDIDPKLVTYSYRHTFITEAMQNGVDIATVAELTATSVEMIRRHYGHLNQKDDHLRDAAVNAVRRSG